MFKLPRLGRSKRATMRRVLLLVILSTFIGDGRALAGTLVEFPNLPGREPLQLIGYLARPDTGLSVLIRQELMVRGLSAGGRWIRTSSTRARAALGFGNGHAHQLGVFGSPTFVMDGELF